MLDLLCVLERGPCGCAGPCGKPCDVSRVRRVRSFRVPVWSGRVSSVACRRSRVDRHILCSPATAGAVLLGSVTSVRLGCLLFDYWCRYTYLSLYNTVMSLYTILSSTVCRTQSSTPSLHCVYVYSVYTQSSCVYTCVYNMCTCRVAVFPRATGMGLTF